MVLVAIIGAASGYFAAGKRGLCAAFIGPLVWILWQLHKSLTDRFGYDSLWLLVGEGVFRCVVGLDVGLVLEQVKFSRREYYCRDIEIKTGEKKMAQTQIYYDQDADLGVLQGKTIAVIGYGSQGRGQSLCLRDSGLNVVIGARPGKSQDAAKADGLEVADIEDAAQRADVIMMLVPDHLQLEIYEKLHQAASDCRQSLDVFARLQHSL